MSLVLALGACGGLASIPDRLVNRVVDPPPHSVAEAASALHGRMIVSDLHADSMLSPRSMARRGEWGQVDFPRLGEANVAIETFAMAVNKSTCGGDEACREHPDLIALLSLASGWPAATWSSYAERAAHMIERLRKAANRFAAAHVVSDAESLADTLAERRAAMGSDKPFAIVLGLEGGEVFEGRIGEIDRFHRAGVRVAGLVHFFDNEIGGSAHGEAAGGLSAFGRAALVEMERLGIIVDLAHASPSLIADTLDLSKRRVLVSHTGVQEVCPGRRNLSDADIRRIVGREGLIAVSMFELTLCPERADAGAGSEGARYLSQIVKSIRHIARIGDEVHPGRGYDFVAIGGDWDGYVRTPFDITGLPRLTEVLLQSGIAAEDAAKVMGANYCRFLLAELPNRQGGRGTREAGLCGLP